MTKKKKSFIGVLALIVALVAIRAAMPIVGKWYINKTLSNGVGGYYGEIKDLDILLIAGQYTIRGLELHKLTNGEVKKSNQPPYLSIAETRFHIFWKALFKGYMRGTVDVNRAVINLIHDSKSQYSQTGAEEGGKGWLPTADALFPMTIEDIRIRNSQVRFINPSAEPPVDVKITNIDLLAENITNAREIEKKRASRAKLEADIPAGHLSAESNFSPLSAAVSFDVDTQLDFRDLTPLNPIFLHYLNFDVEQGSLSISSEVNGDEECMEGYVKPVFKDLEITDANESYKDFSNFLTEQGLGLVNLIVRNYPKDQTATKVEFAQTYEGDFSIKTWKSVGNLFKNAFVQAYDPRVDKELNANSQPKSCQKKG